VPFSNLESTIDASGDESGRSSDVKHTRGLSTEAADALLLQYGENMLPGERPRPWYSAVSTVLRQPMLLMLLICALVYVALGSMRDAIALSVAIVLVIAITVLQTRRTETALNALKSLAIPEVKVQRDGRWTRISSRKLVPGDVVQISEGERVAADATLLEAINVSIDESVLSGESVPVAKMASGTIAGATNTIFCGTLVVQGTGVACVQSTGPRTQIGQIGQALGGIAVESTHIELETARAVKVIAIIALALSVLVTVWYGLERGNWLQGLLAGLTLAIGLLPEEMPVVLTVFLAIGAWRMARHGVLIRRNAAVEMLGAVSILCIDKTGTLTENRMRLSELHPGDDVDPSLALDETVDLPEHSHRLLEYAILASHRNPFDPMERAIHDAGLSFLKNTEHLHGEWNLVEEYPLSPELLALSHVWRAPEAVEYVVAAKGAPEAIADLCHFDAADVVRLRGKVDAIASRGLRVLGVACARHRLSEGESLPKEQHDFVFSYCGLIALADPLRESAHEAVRACTEAGIEVKMITGDYSTTALAIAREAGIDVSSGVLTGHDCDALDQECFRRRVSEVNVFCRVSPSQKLRIVEALKESGAIVAMTGDGVNDAPALKAAHVGIAMGARGTDVARESASIVLVQEDLASIVTAVAEGRRVFVNLRKAFAFLIAAHIPIAGIAILPISLGAPLILLPIHIMFMELIIDPACSIVFEMERAHPDAMRRPPHSPNASLFDRSTLVFGFAQGFAVLAVLSFTFFAMRDIGWSEDTIRSSLFGGLVLATLLLIVANRGRREPLYRALMKRNAAFAIVAAITLVAIVAIFTNEELRAVFRFAPFSLQGLVAVIVSAIVMAISFELIRMYLDLQTQRRSRLRADRKIHND
jgi:P-type Ca2+ transporter type 2C